MPKRDAAVVPDAAPIPCTFDDVSYNGHDYELVEEDLTWDEARTSCAAGGGYLLEINDANENALAEGLLVGFFHVWIGLRDSGGENYRWLDGSRPAYTNWGTVNANNDCVALYAENGRWDTRACSERRWSVCECD